jgi:hypothetical protein
MSAKLSMDKLSDRGRWILILTEIAVCFVIIYVTALLDLPFHQYYRFTVLIPLYQLGITYGQTGGIIGGIPCALLFMPLLRMDKAKQTR